MFRVIAILVVVGMLGGAYKIFTDMQQRIEDLRANNAKLEEVAKTNQETIEQMQADAQQMQKANNELQLSLQESEKYKDSLLSKLQKHNLAKLSLQKPQLIEKRINDATAKVFRDLESLTAQ